MMYLKKICLGALLAAAPAGLGAQLTTNAALMAAPVPLASYAQGQAMMAEAAKKAALLDIQFTFLNKTYEKDTKGTDPFGNTYTIACWRFKATSGFRFKLDVPQYTLTSNGLTVTQNISRIEGDGLTARIRVGPCQDVTAGFGVRISDLTLVYRARPMISFNQTSGACTIGWNQDTDDISISIGDMNITGVQNNLDNLAKDAVREAVNLTLDGFFASMMRKELVKVSSSVCGAPKQAPSTTSAPLVRKR